MKALFRVLAFLAVLAASAGTAQAMEETVSFVTGKEWMRQMTDREKMMSLLPPMALYNKFGVQFQKTVFEYIDSMNSRLEENPVLQGEDVANIFASTIYASEPENRLPLERMEAVFEILRQREGENLTPSIPLSEE